METRDPKFARRRWQEERDSAHVYEALAAIERSRRLSGIYAKLAASEREHSAFWEARALERGERLPAYRPSLRARVLVTLARRFGVAFVIPSITAQELADRDRYAAEFDTGTGMVSDERGHAAVLRMIGAGRHAGAERAAGDAQDPRAAFGNNLRAAVLGATDGLASNLCLIMGVAGGGAGAAAIELAGLAGLIGGACSMALGEWLSVTNAREMAGSQIDRELEQMSGVPSWAQKELALIFETKGLGESEASTAAQRVLAQGPEAVEHLVRTELTVDPTNLGVQPASAAAYSFCLFASGALVPVLPFFVAASRPAATVASAALSLGALFALGLLTSLFNGRTALFSGARQLGVGLAAAGLTYLAGRLFGAVVG